MRRRSILVGNYIFIICNRNFWIKHESHEYRESVNTCKDGEVLHVLWTHISHIVHCLFVKGHAFHRSFSKAAGAQWGIITFDVPYHFLAASIASRIAGSLVSSAGVLPLRSSTVVSAPACKRSSTQTGCFLKAAKWRGYCSLSFGMSGLALAATSKRRTSEFPVRLARLEIYNTYMHIQTKFTFTFNNFLNQ